MGVRSTGAGSAGRRRVQRSGPADVRIHVAAADALFDAPLGGTVTGAPPGKRMTIVASATDSPGQDWRSSATFLPSAGRIVLARAAPVLGDYTGAHDAG